MKGETNNKRQAKLLAAVAVMAMVVCALAVAVPADEAEGAYDSTSHYELDSNWEVPEGVSGIQWDSENSTLTLTNYNGSMGFYYSGSLTIKLVGTNKISTTSGDGEAVIRSTTSLTIQAENDKASLAIVQNNAAGWGISSSTITIGDTSDSDKNTVLEITDGGNRGTECGTMTIQNAIVTINGSERGIRVQTGTLTIINSEVNAGITGTGYVNGQGNDDIEGIKVGGNVSIDATSTVITQGMRIATGSLTVLEGGLLVVDGDYTQNPSADMPYVTTGLVIDNSNQTKLTAIIGDVPATGAKGIYLINGAGTYGNISVTENGKTIKDVVTTSVSNINNISIGKGVESLTIILSDSASNLDIVDVLSDSKFEDVSEITFIGEGTVSSDATMDITGKSVTFNGFTTVTVNVFNKENSAALNGVGGNFTVSQGSVIITGTVSGGTITVDGDVQFNGTVAGSPNITAAEGANVILGQGFTVDTGSTVTFSNVILTSQGAVNNKGTIILGEGLTINGLTVDGGNLQGTIPAKSRVTVQGDVTVTNNQSLTNNGILSVNGELALGTSASLTNNGTIVLMSKDSEIPDNITGTGTVDTSAVASNIDISGDAESTYYEIYQTVTVVGSTTIVDGAGLVIAGTLIINEGVTLTIEDGGFLMVTGSYSKVINNGTILVESDGGSVTINGERFNDKKGLDLSYTTFENNGNISVDYDLVSTDVSPVNVVSIANSNFINNGTFTIAEDNKIDASTGSKFTNAAGATVYVGGSFAGSITNYGSVTIDSASNNIVTVNQKAAGATVSIVTLNGSATVNDTSLEYSKTLANANITNSVVVSSNNADTIEGVVISSVVADISNTDGTKSYYKRIVINGAADVSDSTRDSDSGSIRISGTAYVNDSFSVTDVVVISGDGELAVNGSMTVADGSKVTVNEVTVNGSLTAGSKELGSDVINAAMYCVTSATAQKTYYYTTFVDAVAGASAASVKKVEVTGEVSVPGDVTVPSGMTVEQEGTMTIGSDATVTVTSGGKINVGGQIIVDGTLYIEDKKTGTNRNPDVVSEVKSEGETDVRYTNLRNAIAAAGSAEITIILNGATVITSDLTIPSNVTVDTNGQDFTVSGAKLTVDGTLYLNGSKYSVVDRTSGNITLKGSVVVNGYMKSVNYMLYDGKAYPAGAYYSIGLYSYITSLSNAPSVIGDADGQEITVYGKNTADVVAFVGTATDDVSVAIDKSADIIVSSMTVSYGTISVAAEAKLAGSYGTAAGAVTLTNMTVDATMKIEDRTVISGDAEVQRFYLTGDFSAADDTKVCSVDFTGDVYIATVSIDADYTPANAAIASNGKITVTGNVFIVGTDYSLTIENSAFTVNGTMTVDNSGTFNADVNGDDSKVTVLGTLEIGDNTVNSTAGIARIAYLVVGDEGGTSAAVNGAATVEKLAVYNGSTTDADMQKAIEDAVSTEFYVGDVLWMTAYNNSAADWAINDASKSTATEFKPGNIVNGVFENWQYTGTDGLSDIDASKNVGDYSKLYANVDYNIYSIEVIAGNGIGTIAVNGIVMTNVWGNIYSIDNLVAGTYTITYTVKTGYEGESVMTVDGQVIDGKVTLSGTDVTTVTVNLSDVEPNYNAPVDSEDQGMGLTDYLLIILVVLIVVMAIMVALRLMRS